MLGVTILVYGIAWIAPVTREFHGYKAFLLALGASFHAKPLQTIPAKDADMLMVLSPHTNCVMMALVTALAARSRTQSIPDAG